MNTKKLLGLLLAAMLVLSMAACGNLQPRLQSHACLSLRARGPRNPAGGHPGAHHHECGLHA